MFEKIKTKLENQPRVVKVVGVIAGITLGGLIALVVVTAINANTIDDIMEHVEQTGEIVAENPF